MQVNILGLEEKMCSNVFDQASIQKQLDRQFGKFDSKGIMQVSFRDVKNSGLYEVAMKLESKGKNFNSSAQDETASKALGEAKRKLKYQILKDQEAKKCEKRSPRGGRAAQKILSEQEERKVL